jgi:hypothetical protein
MPPILPCAPGARDHHPALTGPVNEVYPETGRWTKFVDTGDPFSVNLPVERITPRGR